MEKQINRANFAPVSIKKNVIYSIILACSGYVFTLVTYPYVSRVLGVTNIGICNFVNSIVQYFIFFSSLGINIQGVREIARVRNNPEELNRCFSSLFFLNAMTAIVAVVVYLLVMLLVPQLASYRRLLCIGLLQIVMTPFLIEWFYKGIENFRYITLRSLIVKLVYVVSVFLFVKEENDFELYFALSCGMMVLNSLFNWSYKKQYVKFRFSGISISPYIRSYLILGLYMLLTSMYTTLNTTFLGFCAGDKEVGYYTTATKLQTIILSLYTAFTTVMLPRMSSLNKLHDIKGMRELLLKSFNILIVFSIPIVAYSIIYSPQIVRILSGDGYEGAIVPMMIIMPLIFLIGIDQILCIQILMPLKDDKIICMNSLLAAFCGLVMNFILVPHLKSVGSALVLLLSEIAVFISSYYFVRKRFGSIMPWRSIFKNLLAVLPLSYVLYYISGISDLVLSVLTGIVFTVVYVIVVQFYVLKDKMIVSLFNDVKQKFRGA